MTPRRDGETLKRSKGTTLIPKRDGRTKYPYEENDKTSYGDGINAVKKKKDSNISSPRVHQYSARATRYERSTTLTCTGVVRKCVASFQSDRKRGEASFKLPKQAIPKLNTPTFHYYGHSRRKCSLLANIYKRLDYYYVFRNIPSESRTRPSPINNDFMPVHWIPEVVESTAEPLYLASEDLLESL